MRRIKGSWLRMSAVGLSAVMLGTWSGMADTKQAIAQPIQKTVNTRVHFQLEARQRFLEANPGVRIETNPGSRRIVGRAFGGGATPVAAAESFRINHAAAIGADPVDLIPSVEFLGGGNTIPLLYDRETDSYKFTAVYYSQERGGVPVFGSRLTVLVKNQPDNPIVLINPDIRELDDFQPDPLVLGRALNAGSMRSIRNDREINEIANRPVIVSTGKVIWAGMGENKTKPVLADKSIVHNDYDKWLVITDARNGVILHKERQIYFQAVSGNVSGNGTEGIGAEQCEAEVPTPLPYIQVTSGPDATFTDAKGNYTLNPAGGLSVDATTANGQWFDVTNFLGAETAESAPASTPGDLFFNAANTSEQIRAQVNGYIEANEVRDFAIAANPLYPTLNNVNFPVFVNRNDGFCPGNAWYDPGTVDINFCLSGPANPNTAWSSVVQHEYGHHLVQAGGSGQGQYGEGMGDVISQLIGDDPCLGLGFFGDCLQCLRSGDNTMQYPCSGEIHFCGQLISGCLWDTRNALIVTEPILYRIILRDLTINSILLHSGSSIDPSITTDFLVLDDDDGNLDNGTPHSVEILAGFVTAHNMAPIPPATNDNCIDATPACVGTVAGTTLGANSDGSASCASSSASPDVWYIYRPDADGTVTVSTCAGADYDTALSIHTGCPGTAANEIVCNDDTCGTLASVTTAVTSGVDYFIRASGWNGSTGNFNLTLTGPDCLPIVPNPLALSFPNGPADMLAPGVTTNMQVEILDGAEVYVPGSGLLHYRYDGGAFLTSPLASLGANQFEATFPPPLCIDTPEYYISAQGDGGATVFLPLGAPGVTRSAVVGVQTIVMADDFETNQGWTATNLGATSGDWQRGTPVNDPGWAYDPASDGDGSGQCYLTQNQVGNTDVDAGSVRLTSPLIDMSAGGNTIAYEYYLNLNLSTSGIDRLLVEISSNGDAGPWTTIANHNTDGGLSWRHQEITQSDLDAAGVTMTSTMKVRYTANDSDPQSITEAGLDGFTVSGTTCVDPTPSCMGDVTPPGGNGTVNIDDLVTLLGAFGPCAGCPEDITPPGGNGVVNIDDLVGLLGAFGPCP